MPGRDLSRDKPLRPLRQRRRNSKQDGGNGCNIAMNAVLLVSISVFPQYQYSFCCILASPFFSVRVYKLL
ncbi:hypothetical protein C5167_027823 [Papaver somniferum]|nr:hypothetical protein C5167_027823 [Papaver somniferum]